MSEPVIPKRSFLPPLMWCLVWLAVIDLGLGGALRRLAASHPESGLVRYFEYGRSIEAKLAGPVALPPGSPGRQVLEAGWLDPRAWAGLPDRPAPGTDRLVAVYGQSFANNVAVEASRLDGRLTLRRIGGPAAPLDHSYSAWRADQPLRKADVVVVGILASAVAHIGSMSGIDWTFENPAPFTFPRYSLENGALVGVAPAIGNVDAFGSAFESRSDAWRAFKAQLAAHDRGFDPLVFDGTWLDGSNIARLMRRGWVAHREGYDTGVHDGARGFDPDAEPVRVMRAMVEDMARMSRSRGERLIVLLEHDQGYGNHLYLALKETLERTRVEFISSHALFSASDARNFVADGHYTEAANRRFAAALAALIRQPAGAAAAGDGPAPRGAPGR